MKIFKFIALVGFAIIASTVANFVDITTNEIIAGDQTFDDAFKKINNLFDKFLEMAEIPPLVRAFTPLFIRSINTTCMHDNLKNHKFDAKFEDLANRFKSLTNSEKRELAYIHLVTSIRCTKKICAINEFLFDFFLSFDHIVRAFKVETEY